MADAGIVRADRSGGFAQWLAGCHYAGSDTAAEQRLASPSNCW